MAPAPGAGERPGRGEPGEVRGHVHPSRTLDGLSGHPPSRPGGHHRHRAAATTAHRRHVHRRAGGPGRGGGGAPLLPRPPAGQPNRPPTAVMSPGAPVPRDGERAAPLFARAAARAIPLIPQTLIRPHGGGTIKEVRIRALHDGKMIYIELSWSDTP